MEGRKDGRTEGRAADIGGLDSAPYFLVLPSFRLSVLPFVLPSSRPHRFPLAACSRSIASNNARKFPLPKLRAPFRWMIS
jgi:hypothetical protein